MKNKRDELLQVAAQLAAGINAHTECGTRCESNINEIAVSQAKDMIEKVDAELGEVSQVENNESKWISVEDKYPVIDQQCLIMMEVTPNIEWGCYLGDYEWRANWCGRKGKNQPYKVTHWMPLPEPPKARGDA